MSQVALSTVVRSDEPWREPEWQRLWLATQDRPWRSLALVPAGGPPELALEVAMSLARTGMLHIGGQIHVADATTLELESVGEFTHQLRSSMQTGHVIMALAPSHLNPVTVPLAHTADCALLCVLLSHVRIADAKRTLDEIGRNHFIGAITID